MKYEQLCNDILQIISTDNIQDVFCCITRLRLIVKDKSIIDREQLEAIEGVLQVKEIDVYKRQMLNRPGCAKTKHFTPNSM